MEDLLKRRHRRLGGGAVDPVRRNFGDGGVVVRDAVELVLDGLDKAKARLRANVNFTLVMELLFLTIKEN